MIQPGEGIPETRLQAYSLLRAVDGDPDRLTANQIAAIRALFRLDDDRSVAEVMCR